MMCTNNSAVVNGRVSLVGSSILSEQQRQKVTEKKVGSFLRRKLHFLCVMRISCIEYTGQKSKVRILLLPNECLL